MGDVDRGQLCQFTRPIFILRDLLHHLAQHREIPTIRIHFRGDDFTTRSLRGYSLRHSDSENVPHPSTFTRHLPSLRKPPSVAQARVCQLIHLSGGDSNVHLLDPAQYNWSYKSENTSHPSMFTKWLAPIPIFPNYVPLYSGSGPASHSLPWQHSYL